MSATEASRKAALVVGRQPILPTFIEAYELNGSIDDLLELVRRLRAADGCPWDREQTLESVRAYLLEEAHEAAAAIDDAVAGHGPDALREELGDLLFQVAFIGRLAEERGDFHLRDSIRDVHRKMVQRHPHVFSDESGDESSGKSRQDVPADADDVARRWARRKASETAADRSILDGVPTSLPSLVAAYRLGQKAGGVGFDWPDLDPVLAKVREELSEVEAAVESGGTLDADAPADARSRVASEIGDLLFAVTNLARHLDVDPEAALARTNLKFRRRFGAIESELRRRGIALADASLDEMDTIWNDVKAAE